MKSFYELRFFLILWLTQAFSLLGSAMTNFALVLWLYQDSGSALKTAMLTVCSYAPYVLLSIFAGVISDRWNKKAVMLVCDSVAAAGTLVIVFFLQLRLLAVWHLYLLNACNGLMNAVQSPASDVATTLLTPKKYYQKTSGLRSFSNSLVSMLTPVLATAFFAFGGLKAMIAFDLSTFAVAFLVLLLWIPIPEVPHTTEQTESCLQAAKAGLVYLRSNRGIFWLILFLSSINLIASMHQAALPARILPQQGETALGIVNSCIGFATLLGSLLAVFCPKPKNRATAICNCLLVAMSTENFLLAFGRNPVIWCIGSIFGWGLIPLMRANYDVLFRSSVPKEMQGRVYAVRNTLQFFTIPVGYFLGGFLVDDVLEPWLAAAPSEWLWQLFGTGLGSGAAVLFAGLGVVGVAVCLIFRNSASLRALDSE